jgi:hypothetical protein
MWPVGLGAARGTDLELAASPLPGKHYLQRGPRSGGPFVASACARTEGDVARAG